MAASLLKGLLAVSLAAFALTACATESDSDSDDENVGETNDELRSAPLGESDMVQIPTPANMPAVWKQPDSEGWRGARGKCGSTALANELRLYSIEKSPDELDDAGVHFVVGTLQWEIERWLKKNHPELGCRTSYPWDGAKALRGQLDAGHPVMVWFNLGGGTLESHWVTAVGHHGSGDDEKVVVMSWGRYYEIPMKKLDDASKWVYGMRHPTVICSEATDKIVR